MNLKKKITTLAVLGVMATAVASAANIGVDKMNQVVSSYPGYGAIDMKMQAVTNEYRPKIEKEMEAVNKIQDKTQAKAQYDAKVVPLIKKANEEVEKIAGPMLDSIHSKIEAIRVAKGLDVVVDDLGAIQAADTNSKVENVTPDVVASLK